MTDELLLSVARLIANAMGDNFADAFKNKARWIAKRGQSGGRFRDINEPMQEDYLSAAQAAIAALQPALDAARDEGRRAGLEEAIKALWDDRRHLAAWACSIIQAIRAKGGEHASDV